MNKQVLIVIGILLCVAGGVMVAMGPLLFHVAVTTFKDCLDDCFGHCTWCSIEQANALKAQSNLAGQMIYVWIIGGACAVVVGIVCFVRSKHV